MRTRETSPIALALGVALLAACSRTPEAPVTETAPASAATPAATSTPPPAKAIDPCSLLTDAELRSVLPGAGPATPDMADAHAGIRGCQWTTPAGRVWIQVYPSGPSAPELELRTIATGMFDPAAPKALDRMRIEGLPAGGKGAYAFVESADAERGVVSANAVLAQAGAGNIVVLFAPELAALDRKDALKALGTLGAHIGGRL